MSVERPADEASVERAPADVALDWETIVEQHSDRVFRLAMRLTGNRHDAEDLTQEVFVRVFRSLHTYQPGTFEGWLHRITTNLFLDQARRRQRIRFDALSDERAARIASALAGPDMAYDDRTFDADVEAALAALPPDFRAAVVLCDIEGLTYEEIAEILGAKLGTVRSRIHRGRAMLRAALAHRAPQGDRTRYAGPAPLVPRVGASMIGHLGARVSALLDGQLSPAEAEEAWAHVYACHACRDLVEREGWVKTRLAGLSGGVGAASSDLKGSLMNLTPGERFLAESRARSGVRRGVGVAVLGGGALGAAMVGVLALGLSPGSAPANDRRPPASRVETPAATDDSDDIDDAPDRFGPAFAVTQGRADELPGVGAWRRTTAVPAWVVQLMPQ